MQVSFIERPYKRRVRVRIKYTEEGWMQTVDYVAINLFYNLYPQRLSHIHLSAATAIMASQCEKIHRRISATALMLISVTLKRNSSLC